jgi:hypothetical protein
VSNDRYLRQADNLIRGPRSAIFPVWSGRVGL